MSDLIYIKDPPQLSQEEPVDLVEALEKLKQENRKLKFINLELKKHFCSEMPNTIYQQVLTLVDKAVEEWENGKI